MSDKERKEQNEPIKDETLDQVSGGYIIIGPTPHPKPVEPPTTHPGRPRMDPM